MGKSEETSITEVITDCSGQLFDIAERLSSLGQMLIAISQAEDLELINTRDLLGVGILIKDIGGMVTEINNILYA